MQILPLKELKNPDDLFSVRTINTNYGETKKDVEEYYNFLKKKGFHPHEIKIYYNLGLYEFHIVKTAHAMNILTKAKTGEIY